MDVPNIVKMDDYDDFGEYLTALAQAVLTHGYARVWSPRHPNDIYLAVHPPLSEAAKGNLETEFDRVWENKEEGIPF